MVVKCERMDHFGRGICYVDGKIVFVSNLLPLEEADIKIVKSKKRFSEGIIVSLKKKSFDRVMPFCPYENCGCHLKHLAYEKQLVFKEEKVRDIIKRYSGVNPIIRKIIFSDEIYGYRNKITLKVKDGVLGYHEVGTNNIIGIKKCELVSSLVNDVIDVLNRMDLSRAREIVIKEFDGIMVSILGNLDIEPLKPFVSSIYVNDKLVYGDEYIETKIKDLTFRVLPSSFFQVNKYMISKLYDLVISYAGEDRNKKVLDLYCGTGTITLLLNKHFKEVTGIEINRDSIKCANVNKEINGIENVEFICGDASCMIKSDDADIVIVDPPRSGLTCEGINDILRINPERVIYVSCDPMTLARDLKIFSEKYQVKEVTPVDMFPNTYHAECVCLLERHRALIK